MTVETAPSEQSPQTRKFQLPVLGTQLKPWLNIFFKTQFDFFLLKTNILNAVGLGTFISAVASHSFFNPDLTVIQVLAYCYFKYTPVPFYTLSSSISTAEDFCS